MKQFRKRANGLQTHLSNTLDTSALFSIVLSNELWFIGEKFLQDAFAVMMDNKNHFYLL